MPVVVVATFTVKPESVDTVRDILRRAVTDVHDEPGWQLYSLHESGETFVFVIYLPIHASWLNQVEIYFSVLQRKLLTPNDFHSLNELETRLLQFQDYYQQIATPGWDGPLAVTPGRRSAAIGALLTLAGAATLAAIMWGLKDEGLYCVAVLVSALIAARILASTDLDRAD
jgi:hypothetical protein